MNGSATRMAQRNNDEAATEPAAFAHGPPRSSIRIEAFVIVQIAGRPLYLVVGEDAALYLTPDLPFNDD